MLTWRWRQTGKSSAARRRPCREHARLWERTEFARSNWWQYEHAQRQRDCSWKSLLVILWLSLEQCQVVAAAGEPFSSYDCRRKRSLQICMPDWSWDYSSEPIQRHGWAQSVSCCRLWTTKHLSRSKSCSTTLLTILVKVWNVSVNFCMHINECLLTENIHLVWFTST